jgi:hypothetical protein
MQSNLCIQVAHNEIRFGGTIDHPFAKKTSLLRCTYYHILRFENGWYVVKKYFKDLTIEINSILLIFLVILVVFIGCISSIML